MELLSQIEKTAIEFEFAASHNDLNLYSSLDDENDTGVASQLSLNHQLLKTAEGWSLDVNSNIDYIQNNFRNIEGFIIQNSIGIGISKHP